MRNYKQDTAQEQLLKEITEVLLKNNIPYMVTGSISVIFYGRPRSSHDIDFVIDIQEKDLSKITKTFSLLGPKFIVDTTMIRDAVINQSYGFNLLHLPTMLKLDFWLLKDTRFDKERFMRKKRITLFNQDMFFSSPEDTILQKFIWYKLSKIEKHLIDAAFVYQIQKDMLDEKYLLSWTKELNADDLLQTIKLIDLEEHY